MRFKANGEIYNQVTFANSVVAGAFALQMRGGEKREPI